MENSIGELKVKVYDMDQRLRIIETTNREFQRSTEFLKSRFDSLSEQQLKHEKHIEKQAKQ
ncbi:hypothetical protein DPMN_030945 [Dreissena polymorpha]|uniref:Uncharacterized protein n=1 Tax=Dreissena polymorpha TaxID=45954 RepID=A0A9D4RHK0_DREPO|nr:hypothetical protein DPMN_030945 [Dreissena polymorpha]